ncbi:retrovirus-related pol polyprotein from transposon TNT 1-94 [Tanacetum coccineum]
MAKALPTQAWLWHRRLSHLNFDYINLLSKKDVVIGLPKLKYAKDKLCSSCEVGKGKISSFKTKAVPSSKGCLNLLHMELCGPMRVASINGKKYILQLQPYAILKRDLSSSRHMRKWHITSSMTGNLQLNTFTFFCTCYLTRDGENLDKMKEKEDPCILVGYSTQSKGYRVYNKRTRLIVESIHLRFDEIKEMTETSVANDTSGLVPQRQKALDPEMYMFALTASTAEPKTIKEAMANSAWIETMQEELHQFDRLQVWELVDKPFGKNEEGIDFEGSFAPVA